MQTRTRTFKRLKFPKSTQAEVLLRNPIVIERELNNRSFFRFLKTMWPEISSEPFQPNWHIELLCKQLQILANNVAVEAHRPGHKQSISDYIYNVPPGSTKTTILMIMFPAWCWSIWYWMEFIGVSYGSGLSLESAEACRELIRSDRYREVYPDIEIKQDKDQKSNFQVIKVLEDRPFMAKSYRTGGSRYSTSVGGTVTGFHGHFILVDDPINPEQAISPVQLETANRFISQTLSRRRVHSNCSPMVTIMQRLHQNDPTAYQLKKKRAIHHVSLPGEIKNYREMVKPQSLVKYYSEDGLLDPVRLNWAALEDAESDLGQYGYAGQIGQSPTPPQGGMFKVDKLQIINNLPQRMEFDEIVRYWDKAGTAAKPGQKEGRGPAYTAGVKMVRLKNEKYLIMNVVRGQWSTDDREMKIKATAEGDSLDYIRPLIGIEQEPGSGGKESAEATVRRLAGHRVVATLPQGDKATRADPFSVQVNWGNVMLLSGEWNQAFIEELRFFPFSTFKDQVDASSGAFGLLTRKKRVRAIGRRRS